MPKFYVFQMVRLRDDPARIVYEIVAIVEDQACLRVVGTSALAVASLTELVSYNG